MLGPNKQEPDANLAFLMQIKTANVSTIRDAGTALSLTKDAINRKLSFLFIKMRHLRFCEMSETDAVVITAIENWSSTKPHAAAFQAIAANIDRYIQCYQDADAENENKFKIWRKVASFISFIEPITPSQFEDICKAFDWTDLKFKLDSLYSQKNIMSDAEMDVEFNNLASSFCRALTKLTKNQFIYEMAEFYYDKPSFSVNPRKLRQLMQRYDCAFKGEVNPSEALQSRINAAKNLLIKHGYSVTK